MRNEKTLRITMIGLFTAILCVLAPISVPLGFTTVPISLATFAVMLCGSILGSKRGFLSVGIYLLLGMVGVPVFAGYTAGVQKLVGPTGGYLVGFLILAYVTGWCTEKFNNNKYMNVMGMVIGLVLVYLFGSIWFVTLNHVTFGQALELCVIPFLPGDAIKIIGAAVLCYPLRKQIGLLQGYRFE